MTGPGGMPIGLQLTRAAKVVGRAFDEALEEAGGSLPVWLVLMTLKGRTHATQLDVARAVGIEGPTLTHHLHRMEAAGLVTRTRDPGDRRAQQVALTEAGEAMFVALRERVVAFDARLRTGLSNAEVAVLGDALSRLVANVAPVPAPT